MRFGIGARKDGGTESIGVEHQGIPGNPVSSNHHPAPSHSMKIQWKWIDTYYEGRGHVGQIGKKASKGENAIDCTMCLDPDSQARWWSQGVNCNVSHT